MLINLNEPYKSVQPFSIELPQFAILTGVNGAGKTQILKAIAEKKLNVIDPTTGNVLTPVKYSSLHDLTPNQSQVVTRELLQDNLTKIYNLFQSFQQRHAQSPPGHAKIEHTTSDKRQQFIINAIIEDSKKDIKDITFDDFVKHYPINDGQKSDDLFYQNFSFLFKRYHDKLDANRYLHYISEKYGKSSLESITDEEFFKLHGEPPWIFVNKIIKEANLDYEVNSPEGSVRDAPFELKLINTINGANITFNDLSSGEKVLMSLALALYNNKQDVNFPKLLLLDEPDGSLHPSMSKQLLDVILNVFVKDVGMHVIITSHSPSTVALAPEESIYIVNKSGDVKVEKVTKDRALKILSAGIPSFSVNYENRRQVFVESNYDVKFYEGIYNKLSPHLIPDISLNFISSGVGGRGSCDQVIDIVNKLVGYGNKNIYGIIDWDSKNTATANIKVLAEKQKYSIENCILDPLLIGALLLDERIITRTVIGLENNENYTDFKNLSEAQMQTIVDFITAQVNTRIKSTDADVIKTTYVNGKSISVPQWYALRQGHTLESDLKTVFPQLNKFRNEGDLKSEIVNKIMDDVPELIPVDFLILIKELQAI